MTAQEQGPVDANGAPFDENEDLFDFPLIEMTLEGLQERTPGSGAGARSGSAQPTPTAPLPAKAASPSQVSPAAASVEPPPVAPKPALPKPAATSQPKPTAPAPVPIAAVMAASVEPPPVEEVAPPPPRRSRVRGIRIALILLLALNATGFWFLWRTHSTFGAGLDGLRAELDDAALRLERARRDVERGVGVMPGSLGLEAIDALERTALELATNEIRAGEYGSARRRLNRLLVRAERMSPGLRAEIEPRAAFLVAHSYHDEAQARKGAKR